MLSHVGSDILLRARSQESTSELNLFRLTIQNLSVNILEVYLYGYMEKLSQVSEIKCFNTRFEYYIYQQKCQIQNKNKH